MKASHVWLAYMQQASRFFAIPMRTWDNLSPAQRAAIRDGHDKGMDLATDAKIANSLRFERNAERGQKVID